MSSPALVSFVFGLYALGMGLGLIAMPDPLLAVFGLPPTDEPWVRMAGAMAFALGLYYMTAGRAELVPFFKASVVGRLAFAAVAVACGIAWSLPAFHLFAAIDAGSAVLTVFLLWKARPA
jgi:hypothetical protein